MSTVNLKEEIKSTTIFFIMRGTVCSKPRMTQRDTWKQRPCVMRYRDFADRLRAAANGIVRENPFGSTLIFHIGVKPSWSKKKQAEFVGKMHRLKCDVDNLEKGVFDALLKNDAVIAKSTVEKYWCLPADERVEVTFRYEI